MNKGSNRRRTRAVVLVAAVLLAIGLVWGLVGALAASESPSPAGEKVVLKVGWIDEPDNLNPFIGYLAQSFEVWYMNYDRLVGINAETLEPTKGEDSTGLAIAWSTSPDRKTWTFKLRSGVMWQDGVPLTAKDVAFTYNYIIDNELGNFTSYTQLMKEVVAVDDTTVEVRCSKPKADMLNHWIPILPEHVWGKVKGSTAETTYVPKPPFVGSGPFQCTEWKKKGFVRMVANKDYWGGAPKVDEVLFTSYTNPDTMGQEMLAGTIDACWGLLDAQLRQLEDAPGIEAKSIVINGFDELGFNCYALGKSLGHPILKDVKFRQALNYAVDKEKIVEIAYGGQATAADTVVTRDYYKNPDWHWDPGDQAYTFDLEKCKTLLDEAGYKDTDGDGIREYKGKPIELRLWARSENQNSQSCGKLVKGWFTDVGLKIKYDVMDDGALSSKMYNLEGDTFVPDFDMFFWGWYSDINPAILMSYFTKDQINSWSDCNYFNPEYDKLYEEQASEEDIEKRKEMLWKMQEILYRDSPYILMAYSNDIEAWNTAKWEGWFDSPDGVGNYVIFPYDAASFMKVGPKTGASEDSGGTNWTVWGIVIAVIVIVAIVVVVMLMRRKPQAVEE